MGCEDGPSDDGEARGVRLEISHKEMDLSGILWKHSSKKPLEDGVGPRTKRKLNLLAGKFVLFNTINPKKKRCLDKKSKKMLLKGE